jgi:carbon monoxide dehydrogenase subunit G
MKVAGSYTFEAPPETVWEMLQNPTVLTSVLPGCESLEEVGENQYEGELNIKVGPVQGKFKGRVEMHDLEPIDGFTLAVDGRGNSGFVKATAKVGLEGAGDSTIMNYDSDAQVGGRIASVGQRLLDSSARSIIQQSLDGLHALMKQPAAVETEDAAATEAGAETGAEPGAGYQPPSQAEFAAKVARDVAKDLISRPVLVGGIILLVLIILFLLLT